MGAGNTDDLILPVPPEPFGLIVGGAMRGQSADALETALRERDAGLEAFFARFADELRQVIDGIARGFGMAAYDLGNEADPLKALARGLSEPGPCLINVPINREDNVFPMVPPGAANRNMIGGETHASK